MAMLAGPKQRKHYNLVPRGKALYEDDSRYGTKILEKMGWSKGKGLGAKEDGSQDFVRVRYKNDAQGFGYEQRDDQWTQHEDSFNGLLKTLNGEEEAANVEDSKIYAQQGNDSEEDMPKVGFGFEDPVKVDTKQRANKPKKLKENISGISLEERSKQSKARLHYKKFTKGKDLAQYSEKDLANIFGKKVVDEQQQAINDYYEQLNKSFGKTEEETKQEKSQEGEATEKLSGVQIISSGVSVADYFKKKMEEMKNRRNGNNTVNKLKDDTITEVQTEEVSKKKKKKENKDQEEKPQPVENDEPSDKYASNHIINTGVSVADYFKNKMEEKKNRLNGLAENKLEEKISIENPEEEVSNKKKKKKKEKKNKEEETQNINNLEEEITTNTRKSKKADAELVEDIPMVDNEAFVSSKKYKSKKKVKKEDLKQQQKELEITFKEQPKTKKRKHENTEEINDEDPQEHYPEVDLTQEPEKKKKIKNKSEVSTEVLIIDDTPLELEAATKDKSNSTEKRQKKNSKNKPQINDSSAIEVISPTSKTTNINTSSKKPKKKDVSNEAFTLDDLKTKYQSYNIYKLSSFCAEKFRNINLNHFTGSVLPQVDGYGLTQNIQLEVEINKNDEERITNLWKSTLNKYSQLEKPKKTYNHYVKEVIKARKTKQKRPKLYVKTWKRKNAFQII